MGLFPAIHRSSARKSTASAQKRAESAKDTWEEEKQRAALTYEEGIFR